MTGRGGKEPPIRDGRDPALGLTALALRDEPLEWANLSADNVYFPMDPIA
jgi:hypothetical protein